ncbi:hypothetical protein EJ02DRAFT_452893 [Clathrospora elynae]|uniref:Uncharacterized protein n=1 Tax=Clathrospora elynae TaxID=706981 RepID=A0A6A5SVJ0_9PLEO|nr:hypothetical protein EJ02DRAFT_452893 [Clathrospora elynae]
MATISRLHEIELRHKWNLLSTAWTACVYPWQIQRLIDATRRLQSLASVKFKFGEEKFAKKGERPDPMQHVAGDLVQAIERCRRTTHGKLERDPELMSALGMSPGLVDNARSPRRASRAGSGRCDIEQNGD